MKIPPILGYADIALGDKSNATSFVKYKSFTLQNKAAKLILYRLTNQSTRQLRNTATTWLGNNVY